MNKEFVTYEQALALKELGFDESCFGYYGVENEFSLDTMKNTSPNYSRRGFISTPLYQQAFRWFREKHNIKPCFDWHPTEEYRYCIYYSVNTYFQKCDFKTYEESERACLSKLIEICKNK